MNFPGPNSYPEVRFPFLLMRRQIAAYAQLLVIFDNTNLNAPIVCNLFFFLKNVTSKIFFTKQIEMLAPFLKIMMLTLMLSKLALFVTS